VSTQAISVFSVDGFSAFGEKLDMNRNFQANWTSQPMESERSWAATNC